MRIGIIGSGGREHAICASIKKSKKIEKIYCFPGNAGTDKIAENISIDLNNFKIIKNFIHENNIELIIVDDTGLLLFIPIIPHIIIYIFFYNFLLLVVVFWLKLKIFCSHFW